MAKARLIYPAPKCYFCLLDLSNHEFRSVDGTLVSTPLPGSLWCCAACTLLLFSTSAESFPCPMVRRCQCRTFCLFADLYSEGEPDDHTLPFAPIVEP
jgi:hypothetical protein